MTDLTLPSRHPAARLTRVYVWEVPVRAAHWLIVLSLVGLSITGIFIGNPIRLFANVRDPFVMGWMRVIHFYFAIVFVLAVVARVIWMFTGNEHAKWNKLIPVRRYRQIGLWKTLEFYLWIDRTPPRYVGHNPLAGMVYLAVFVLFFVQIGSGLAIYAASANIHSPFRSFEFLIPLFGGLALARWIHHIVMWLLIGFAVHHVYSAILVSNVEGNGTLDSIFSGHKFVEPEDVVEARE